MFKPLRLFSSFVLTALVLGGGYLLWQKAVQAAQPEQQLAKYVDLDRYLGKWYEVARIPNPFQPESHVGGSDSYEKLPDGSLQVIYGWHEKSLTAPAQKMVGKIRVVDQSHARMKVQFFWPFEADYWVVELADDYSYTVVGYPDRSMAWVMSRSPVMDEALYQGILTRLKTQGYPIEKLVRVPQPADAPIESAPTQTAPIQTAPATTQP
jgi:apolipoprotein D and lipocalin family protein